MISTANYVARKYGVRSAMPGFIGKVLCSEPAPGSSLPPAELVFVGSGFGDYGHVSTQVKGLLREFDPYLRSGGIDEAYLDITDYMAENRLGAEAVAERIRARIREAEYTFLADPAVRRKGLTCSCGVAPNRRLAKVCSDINKPDGQFLLPPDRGAVLLFVSTLPIRKVGGIGRVSERMLHEVFGVDTCGQVLEKRAEIAAMCHKGTAEFLFGVGLGLGGTSSHEVCA